MQSWFHTWNELYAFFFHPTPTLAVLYVLVALGLTALLVLHLWHEQRRRPTVWLVLTTLLLPTCILFGLGSLRGMHGVPDERCHLYDEGKAYFELLSLPVPLPVRADAPLNDDITLTLLVRSQTRWGGNPHLCTLPMDHPKARSFMKMLAGIPTQELMGRFARWDYLIFSFGAEREIPTFSWRRPLSPPTPEKGEADSPPREFEL